MPITMEKTLATLKQIKGRLLPIAQHITKIHQDADQHDAVLSRAAFAQTLHDDANVAHKNTFMDEEEVQLRDELQQIIVDIDELFFSVEAIRLKTIRAQIPSPLSVQSNTRTADSSSNVKLPKINIKPFDGDRKEWPAFFDLFRTLVHEKENISNIERFQYLRMYLSGEPLAIINGIKFLGDNYHIAYKAIVDRYEDKRLLATNYWQTLCNAKKINSDSPNSLRDLLNLFVENTTSLLQFNLDMWDFTIVNWMLQKLDQPIRQRFEVIHDQSEIPTFEELKKFLEKQCRAMETSNIVGEKSIIQKQLNKKPVALIVSSSSLSSCILCKEKHLLYQCKGFQSKTPSQRFDFAKEKHLCLNCLMSSHSAKNCVSKFRCKHCQALHHTLLHFPNSRSTNQSAATPNAATDSHSVATLTSFRNQPSTTVLLASAKVWMFDSVGNPHIVRALLDSGSQSSFITEQCKQRLKLKSLPTTTIISGLGQASSKASSSLSCIIASRNQSDCTIDVDVLVVPKICDEMPSISLPTTSWNHTKDLELADPDFYAPNRIDMLIGADVFPFILLQGRKMGALDEPVALETRFGWILSGKVNCKPSSFCSLLLNTDHTVSLDTTLRKFWEIEQVPNQPPPSKEDQRCESLFVKNCRRNEAGRFVVSLPFKGIEPSFHNSRSVAFRRFLSLERRLVRDQNLHLSYCAFMKDYLESGHMKLVPHVSSQSSEEHQPVYYIPHHCVLRPDSLTTKLRVVFDASAVDRDGYSLNSSLLIGEKLQKDIMELLSRFRLHQVVITADLKQMYRQILIEESQHKYQRILWRFDPSDPIQDYELTTVTYGVNSSPFLALRTILEIAHLAKGQYPLAEKALTSDVYVDDLVTGCSSINEARQLIDELNLVLNSCGFEFRKWTSNNPTALQDIPEEHTQTPVEFDADSNVTVKILGLQWLPSSDSFSYMVKPIEQTCTKRTILSELARIFDPLGFLAPLTFFAKHLIQKLWCLSLDWDETPPDQIVEIWHCFKEQLPDLTTLRIPRHIDSNNGQFEMHAFCDASESGYAAVIYLRASTYQYNSETYLVCAKSKVAPLKRLSIPRLELCAAVLLTNLVSFVLKSLSNDINIISITACTDSTIVLNWINSSPHRWQTFVANRVTHIQEIVPAENWRHSGSAENPADCASRGLLPTDLINHPLWWHGPSWISLPESEWPQQEELPTVVEEEKKVVLFNAPENNKILDLLDNYSSLPKILRIVSYCVRFIKPRDEHSRSHFTQQELHNSLLKVVSLVQKDVFGDIIKLLSSGSNLPKFFRKLNPFLDSAGLIRVGGRLSYSKLLLYNEKHPILMPSDHTLTHRIIEDTHKIHLHPGLNTLHSLLRQNFWILSAKRTIASRLAKCYRCFRVKPPVLEPSMGNLPSFRISQIKPFAHVGIDFGGPFSITLGKHRGAKSYKAYVCIFVCMATKAIHLELASELSAEAFLAALRRFIARRGRCNDISSDNGTNFVGARNLMLESMCFVAAEEKIEWHFNPPSAPHFGGIWEAGIKSVKTHLSRVIGDQMLTYEELNTVFVQIEALLNSRPLCAISSDPNDLTALTPGHFLTLEPLTTVPDSNLLKTPLNRLNRWQLLVRLHQDFWKRWSREYLHTLQQRQKWTKSSSISLEIGQLVVIRDDRLPPLKWRLGRIEQLHPGRDGICRVVTLKTSQGVMQRPVVKISPLPQQ